jgi:hypothetical protein
MEAIMSANGSEGIDGEFKSGTPAIMCNHERKTRRKERNPHGTGKTV